MIDRETVLEEALDAFWAKVAEAHPEREAAQLPFNEAYALENWAQHAYEVWLETNKPVYYVQRTVTQVLRITGAADPEEAEAYAADISDADWFEHSLDTNYEYLVLDRNGKSGK